MRLKDIEKIRAMAMLMVLLGHMPLAIPPIFVHGYTGVVLFFIISGYVCCLSFEKTMSHYSSRPVMYGALEFYVARFFRVIPLITIWLLIYFFVSMLTYYLGGSYGDIGKFFKEFGWWNTGLYNYFYAYSRTTGLFGHFWSLAIELQFYLVLPLFYLICSTPGRRCIGALVVIITSIVFLAITPADIAGKLTHTQMGSIFVGVLIYVIREKANKLNLCRVPPDIKKLITTVLMAAIFFLPYWLDGTATPVIKYTIYMIIGGLLVYLAQLDTGWFVEGKIVTAALLKIASLSFSIYVSHVLLYSCVYFNFYHLYLRPKLPWLVSRKGIVLQASILLLVTFLIGELSCLLIEKPYACFGKKITSGLREKHSLGTQQ